MWKLSFRLPKEKRKITGVSEECQPFLSNFSIFLLYAMEWVGRAGGLGIWKVIFVNQKRKGKNIIFSTHRTQNGYLKSAIKMFYHLFVLYFIMSSHFSAGFSLHGQRLRLAAPQFRNLTVAHSSTHPAIASFSRHFHTNRRGLKRKRRESNMRT